MDVDESGCEHLRSSEDEASKLLRGHGSEMESFASSQELPSPDHASGSESTFDYDFDYSEQKVEVDEDGEEHGVTHAEPDEQPPEVEPAHQPPPGAAPSREEDLLSQDGALARAGPPCRTDQPSDEDLLPGNLGPQMPASCANSRGTRTRSASQQTGRELRQQTARELLRRCAGRLFRSLKSRREHQRRGVERKNIFKKKNPAQHLDVLPDEIRLTSVYHTTSAEPLEGGGGLSHQDVAAGGVERSGATTLLKNAAPTSRRWWGDRSSCGGSARRWGCFINLGGGGAASASSRASSDETGRAVEGEDSGNIKRRGSCTLSLSQRSTASGSCSTTQQQLPSSSTFAPTRSTLLALSTDTLSSLPASESLLPEADEMLSVVEGENLSPTSPRSRTAQPPPVRGGGVGQRALPPVE